MRPKKTDVSDEAVARLKMQLANLKASVMSLPKSHQSLGQWQIERMERQIAQLEEPQPLPPSETQS